MKLAQDYPEWYRWVKRLINWHRRLWWYGRGRIRAQHEQCPCSMGRWHSGLCHPGYFRTYTDGFGRTLRFVHKEVPSCADGCVVHHPSSHSMRDFPTYWRSDRGLMERICPHGVGHPDPDDLRYKESIGLRDEGIHGCDGCCSSIPQPVRRLRVLF